jgi:hypothetical protein
MLRAAKQGKVEGARMDQDTNLFVQAFWVKCREVIRPEIDTAIGDMRSAGHDGNVSTQEFSAVPDGLPGHAGPSLTLAIRRAGSPESAVHPSLEFHGDAARQAIDILASDGRKQSYEIADLGPAEVKAELDGWLARLAALPPA